jgi:hypothetical protein
MNESNLKPVQTKEEARERGRKGGIASGKARRERKTLKEELLALLSNGDTQEKISLSLIQQALEGNTKAFEIIRDTVGEKPKEEIEVSRSTDETIKEIDDYLCKKKN